jgi:hypothetical protein
MSLPLGIAVWPSEFSLPAFPCVGHGGEGHDQEFRPLGLRSTPVTCGLCSVGQACIPLFMWEVGLTAKISQETEDMRMLI